MRQTLEFYQYACKLQTMLRGNTVANYAPGPEVIHVQAANCAPTQYTCVLQKPQGLIKSALRQNKVQESPKNHSNQNVSRV